jgi:selenocysteine-specific elongation factor
LLRRGDAARRAAVLVELDGAASAESELRRRGIMTRDQLKRLGVRGALPAPVAGDWVVDDELQAALRERLLGLVHDHRRTHPLEPGIAIGAAAALLDLPDPALVPALLPQGLSLAGGRVTSGDSDLPPAVARCVDLLRAALTEQPFDAPDAHRLEELGLGRREVAAAARAGVLLVLAEGLVLLPDAPARARELLARLPTTFTVSEARQEWSTTRRVALPLLELLDRSGVTERLPDGRRRLVDRS